MTEDVTTSLVSGSIRFTGLGSGTDFDSMITKLIEAEKTRTKRLESWRSQWETKSEEFDKLSEAMLSLKSTLDSMNTQDEFLIKKVNSSNSAVLSATASSTAEEGSHEVEVVSLATTDMHMGSAVFSSTSAVVGNGSPGTFSFAYGNHQISVDTTETTTLAQFVNLINTDPDNRNYVRASVVNDGSGFRLQIRGMDLGAGNDFIVESATNLPNFETGGFIQTQNASNAKLKVDGWPNTLSPTRDQLSATIADGDIAATDTFKVAYNGSIYSFTGHTSVTSLASAIDASSPLQAEFTDGKLILTGESAGSNYQISVIDSPGTTVAGLQSRAFTQILGATDGYIERQSNTISDVVAGVTMNLATTGKSTLTTGTDREAILENVRTFVTEVNSVLSLIRDQTKVTTVGEKSSGSVLTGNYGVQMIQQKLKNILAEKGLGFDYDMDPVSSLGSVGITTDTSEGSTNFGLLIFDEDAFTSSLERNPEATSRLFSADYYPSTKEYVGGLPAESSNFKFDSYIKGITKAGDFAISYTVSGGVITSASINGYPANVDGNKIVATDSANPARGLAVEVLNLTDNTYSGQMQIKSGKTEEISQEIKKLTDPQSGTLEILNDNYQDIMDAIDDKIAFEERRLTLMERTLRMRFANLEAVLGNYDNIANQLSSQIKSLPGKSS